MGVFFHSQYCMKKELSDQREIKFEIKRLANRSVNGN
jgi:hypothetical protein